MERQLKKAQADKRRASADLTHAEQRWHRVNEVARALQDLPAPDCFLDTIAAVYRGDL